MTLDQTLEKETTITFPRTIDNTEIEPFLQYLSNALPAEIKGTQHQHKNFKPDATNTDFGTLKYGAMLVSQDPFFTIHYFDTIPSNSDTSLVAGIKFDTVGKEELSEYTREERQVWKDTRAKIADYFATYKNAPASKSG
jgi:hypothetical protein